MPPRPSRAGQAVPPRGAVRPGRSGAPQRAARPRLRRPQRVPRRRRAVTRDAPSGPRRAGLRRGHRTLPASRGGQDRAAAQPRHRAGQRSGLLQQPGDAREGRGDAPRRRRATARGRARRAAPAPQRGLPRVPASRGRARARRCGHRHRRRSPRARAAGLLPGLGPVRAGESGRRARLLPARGAGVRGAGGRDRRRWAAQRRSWTAIPDGAAPRATPRRWRGRSPTRSTIPRRRGVARPAAASWCGGASSAAPCSTVSSRCSGFLPGGRAPAPSRGPPGTAPRSAVPSARPCTPARARGAPRRPGRRAGSGRRAARRARRAALRRPPAARPGP